MWVLLVLVFNQSHKIRGLGQLKPFKILMIKVSSENQSFYAMFERLKVRTHLNYFMRTMTLSLPCADIWLFCSKDKSDRPIYSIGERCICEQICSNYLDIWPLLDRWQHRWHIWKNVWNSVVETFFTISCKNHKRIKLLQLIRGDCSSPCYVPIECSLRSRDICLQKIITPHPPLPQLIELCDLSWLIR